MARPSGLFQVATVALDLGGTAVYEEFNAVHEAGITGCEKECDCCDLFRTSHFAAWNLRLEILLRIWTKRIENRGVDRSWTQDIHADISFLEVDQPRACERSHRSLACTIDAKGRKAFDAGDRTVQEDGTTVGEEWQRLLHCEERATHVEVEGLVEVFFRHFAYLC